MSEADGIEPRSDTLREQGLSPEQELDIRRYEARLGVWKIVLGTAVVGLAGVLIPGAISFYSAVGDWQRQTAEGKLAKDIAHQQYIKEFFDTAVNQNIELRIRFANYFANLSDVDQRPLWVAYLDDLVEQRDTVREQIGALERRLVKLLEQKQVDPDSFDTATFDEVRRQLDWAHAEVGYAILDRSVVSAPVDKKERLYTETIAVAGRLATQEGNIDRQSPDFQRFQQLYEKELIGVESFQFELKMIEIFIILKSLANAPAPPTPALQNAVDELSAIAQRELTRPQSIR